MIYTVVPVLVIRSCTYSIDKEQAYFFLLNKLKSLRARKKKVQVQKKVGSQILNTGKQRQFLTILLNRNFWKDWTTVQLPSEFPVLWMKFIACEDYTEIYIKKGGFEKE